MPENLLEPEFEPHFSLWKSNPSPKNTDSLLKALHPVTQSALTTYTGSQAASPTLASRAKILTLNSLPNYDPSKAKLRTYMMYQLQSLRRAAAREERSVSAPEKVLLDLNHLHESTTHLQDRLGREPSDIELADHTGLSRKRLSYIRSMRPTYSEGSMLSRSEEGQETFAPSIEMGTSHHPALWEMLYHDADPTDQVILEYTLGLHGKAVLPNQSLAAKLRLSPGAISQRKARLQTKLDQMHDLRML